MYAFTKMALYIKSRTSNWLLDKEYQYHIMICFVEGAFIKWCDWSFLDQPILHISYSTKWLLRIRIDQNIHWGQKVLQHTWLTSSQLSSLQIFFLMLTKNAKLYIVEGKVIGNLNSGRKWHFRTKHRWWLGRIIPLVCRGKHPKSGSPYVLTNANRHWKWDAYYFFLNGIDVTVPVNGNLNSFKYNKLYKL